MHSHDSDRDKTALVLRVEPHKLASVTTIASMSTPSTQNTPSAAATSQIVTLPAIPELFDPSFLDVLVPATRDAPILVDVPEIAPNAMMDALRSTAHQKRTANNAPAFSSTLVPTLDAYLGLRTGISGEKVDSYLENAWAVDSDLTLRIIWSTRSIHDGKGEKELFHRCAPSSYFAPEY